MEHLLTSVLAMRTLIEDQEEMIELLREQRDALGIVIAVLVALVAWLALQFLVCGWG